MLRTLLTFAVTVAAVVANMPPPFTRVLELETPPQNGTDVFILQNLLSHFGSVTINSVFDKETSGVLAKFQSSIGAKPTGTLDASTATAVLNQLTPDGYRDNGTAPGEMGYKYKVYLPVHRNRSIETTASLIAANGTVLFQFQARAHGTTTYPVAPWPAFNDCCDGLNQFSSDGNTPTGLIEFDLNSPEDDPTEFGPYPVNRAVQGIEGNAAWLIPNIRDGILLHTGAWSNYSTWQPPKPMPNSLGCIHAWPESIYTIWQILVNECGVIVNPNTDGQLPYPYTPQGLLSVELID